MLFTAILTLAGICLYRGWIKAFAPAALCRFRLSPCPRWPVACLARPSAAVGLVFLTLARNVPLAGARDGALAFGLLLVLLLAGVRSSLSATADANAEDLLETNIWPRLEAWKLQGQDSWIIVALLAVLASLDAALAVPSWGGSVPSSRVSWSTASNAPARAGCGAAPS